jgi:superfamily II DNA or RNA helicase
MVAVVQEESLPAVWSRGVSLARRGAVFGESRTADEWSFRVRLPSDAIAPRVILYPEDSEWDCDCDGPTDPCEHVAACAIACGDPASLEGLFADDARIGGIRYEFRKDRDGLRLERRLVSRGRSREVHESLEEILEGPDAEPDFEPTGPDVSIDLLLRGRQGLIPEDRMSLVLQALVGVEDVFAEGRPVRVSVEPIRPRALVADRGSDHVELTIELPSEVSRQLAPGLVCLGEELRPMAARVRLDERWEQLPYRRRFGPGKMAELVSRILPRLESEADVEIRGVNLPSTGNAVPLWIEFSTESQNGTLDVLPQIVYGRPPVARVEQGALVLTGEVVPPRDEAAERALTQRLRGQLNLVPGRWAHFSAADGARFLSDIRSFDSGVGAGAGDRASNAAAAPTVALLPQIDGGETSLFDDVAVVFAPAGGPAGEGDAVDTVDARTVVKAWREGVAVVPLREGGFGTLPSGWLRDNGAVLEDFLAAREANRGVLPKAATALLSEICDSLDAPPPFIIRQAAAWADAAPSGASGAGDIGDVAPDFCGSLRGYQEQGVAWLSRLRQAGLGGVLADDMGLGKTVQTLCAVRGRTLVVCPRTVIHNWAREAATFVPDRSLCLYHGAGRKIVPADLTLTTYATLRRDAVALSSEVWDAVVLDEAQAIKNPESQVAQAAYGLRAEFRLSLSGTPVENRLDELWSQMHFTNPGFLGGRSHFSARYEKPILDGDATALARLRARLEPFVLRRLKKEVAADLPPRTETTLYSELGEDERETYDALRETSRREIGAKFSSGGNVMSAFEALLRLRQAACHRGLLPGVDAAGSSKVEALLGALEDVVGSGHKALVFSQWTQFLDRIESSIGAAGFSSVRLDGATRDRAAVVDRFQQDPDVSVFLISLQAGGTGLNLTAADHVFFMDPWWNPAVEQQAADRAHRIGQDRPVMVYRLVSKDTVEERVLALQERKRGLADATLAAGGLSGAAVTRAEILDLLD